MGCPAQEKYLYTPCWRYLYTSPAPEKYLYTPEKYLHAPPEKYLYTSPAPEKPEKYLYTPIPSICSAEINEQRRLKDSHGSSTAYLLNCLLTGTFRSFADIFIYVTNNNSYV